MNVLELFKARSRIPFVLIRNVKIKTKVLAKLPRETLEFSLNKIEICANILFVKSEIKPDKSNKIENKKGEHSARLLINFNSLLKLQLQKVLLKQKNDCLFSF